MIKPSELRIGNWLIKDDKYSQLDSIHRYVDGRYYLKFADDVDRELESVSPIPITLQLFTRTGLFKKKINGFFEFSPNVQYFEMPSTGKPAFFGLYMKHDWILSYQYVHELQNLYFALTKEELELRL